MTVRPDYIIQDRFVIVLHLFNRK